MTKDSITFGLEGEVILDEFKAAINNFDLLLKELSKEVGQETKVDWVIEELQAASATVTLRGICDEAKVVEQIVDAYEIIGESLQFGREIPYSSPVRKYAFALTNILNGRIIAIRFETQAKDFFVSVRVLEGQKTVPMRYTLGSVKGIVQTLSRRKKLAFTLWNSMFDKPVSCYFKEGDEENMRNAWGKRVIVSGRVGRQPETGRPIVVRDVTAVKVWEPVKPGSYRLALGVIPWSPGDELPEKAIRRLRNAF